MKRITGLLLTLSALALPSMVQAQKPSDVSETRSADVYLDNASKSTLKTEQQELYQKAINIALQGAQKYPNNPKPWFLIGKAYALMNDYVGADSAFAKAQAMYPDYASQIAPMRHNMWVSLYNDAAKKINAGDGPGGIESLKLATQIDPTNPEGFRTLASVYLQLDDQANAEKAYKQELTILRSDARKKVDAKTAAAWSSWELGAVTALSTIYSNQQRFDEAEAMYRDLLAKDPQNPAYLSNLAVTLSRAKKDAEANTIYNQLLSRNDLTPTQLLNVGVGLNNSGDYAKAAQAFERALQINPYSHDLLDYRLRALAGAVDGVAKDKTNTAAIIAANKAVIEAGQRLLAIDPANAPALLNVADAQRQISELDAANAAKWKNDVLATLTTLDKLPYSVVNVQSDADDKTITLKGTVMGLEKSKGGSTGTLRFYLIDKDGKTVAQKDVTAVVPAKEQMVPFTVTIDAPASAVAWKYEVIS